MTKVLRKLGVVETQVLFVSHMPIDDPYGAAGALRESIAAILDNVPGYSFAIAAPGGGGRLGSDRPSADVKLPMVMNFIGGLPAYQALPWNEFTRIAIWERRRRGCFDAYFDLARSSTLVHVNSLSLSWLPIFTRRHLGSQAPPFICHVREMARSETYRKLKDDLAALDGLVCIDSSTHGALNRASLLPPQVHVQTIGDLIAVVDAPDTDLAASLREWAAGAPILGMAGRIDPIKGMAFVSSLMQEGDDPPWRLVIAGRASTHPLRHDSRAEFRRITHVAKRFPHRVRYLGEVPDLPQSGFFNGIDLLVRGEPIPSAGLTVYEALAAGVPAVLPGTPADFVDNERIARDQPGLHFATPRDASSYRYAINQALESRTSVTSDLGLVAVRRREHALALVAFQEYVADRSSGS